MTVHSLVIDEGRDCPPDTLDILRPCLLRHSGNLLSISTPNGNSWLTALEEQPDTRVWILPSTSNPWLPKEEIQRLRESLPEKFAAQELDAEIVDMQGSLFAQLVHCDEQESPRKSHNYAIGIDIAASSDFTVAAVLDLTEHSIVHLDRYQLGHIETCNRLEALIRRWNPDVALIETNGIGRAIFDDLNNRDGLSIVPWLTTNPSKLSLVNMWLKNPPRVIQHKIAAQEFSSFVAERLSSGLYVYRASHGGHDDIVMACLIANKASQQLGGAGIAIPR